MSSIFFWHIYEQDPNLLIRNGEEIKYVEMPPFVQRVKMKAAVDPISTFMLCIHFY